MHTKAWQVRTGSFLLILALILLIPLSSGQGAQAAAKTYKSCAALNKDFKYGVAKTAKASNRGKGPIFTPSVNSSVYGRNLKLDTDRDLIACEVLKPQLNPLPTSDTALSLEKPLETCQLKETENFTGAGAKGFPGRRVVSATGTVKIAIIPVDFSNAVGSGKPQELFADDAETIATWGRYFSRGKLNYQVEFKAKDWVRAPKGAEWYTCLECQKGAKEQKQPQSVGIQELINLADGSYDFSNTNIIYFVFPYAAEKNFGTAAYSHQLPLVTNEGRINVAVYGEMGGGVGAVTDRNKIWDHAVHEFLHFQGFIGHGPDNGSDYYVSTNQWGASKAVTSWEAFLNGWFDRQEILCIDKADIKSRVTLTLDSIDNFGENRESLMIRLNNSELLIVERRENGNFTSFCSNCGSKTTAGFTAYRLNVNGQHYRNDGDPDAASKNFWSYIKSGSTIAFTDFVEYSQLRISRVSSTQISIEPTG